MDSQDPYVFCTVADIYHNKTYEIRLKGKTWQIRDVKEGTWFLFLSTEIIDILNERFISLRLVEDELRLTASTEMIYYAQRINVMRKIMGDRYFKAVIKELEVFGDALAEAMPIDKPKEKVKPTFTIVDSEPNP